MHKAQSAQRIAPNVAVVDVPPSELAEHRSLSRGFARALFEPESFFDSGELRSARLKRGAQGTARSAASDRAGASLLTFLSRQESKPPAAREPHHSFQASPQAIQQPSPYPLPEEEGIKGERGKQFI